LGQRDDGVFRQAVIPAPDIHGKGRIGGGGPSQKQHGCQADDQKLDSPFQAWRENTLSRRWEKEFSKTACGWHGMGYVFNGP
jgi:hypothetical protein